MKLNWTRLRSNSGTYIFRWSDIDIIQWCRLWKKPLSITAYSRWREAMLPPKALEVSGEQTLSLSTTSWYTKIMMMIHVLLSSVYYISVFMCVYQIITPLKLIVNRRFSIDNIHQICLKHMCQRALMHQNVLKTHMATGLKIGSSLIKHHTNSIQTVSSRDNTHSYCWNKRLRKKYTFKTDSQKEGLNNNYNI